MCIQAFCSIHDLQRLKWVLLPLLPHIVVINVQTSTSHSNSPPQYRGGCKIKKARTRGFKSHFWTPSSSPWCSQLGPLSQPNQNGPDLIWAWPHLPRAHSLPEGQESACAGCLRHLDYQHRCRPHLPVHQLPSSWLRMQMTPPSANSFQTEVIGCSLSPPRDS